MKSYKFLRSDFTDPIITGRHVGGLSAQVLDFRREFVRVKAVRGKQERLKIVVTIHFEISGYSHFKFEIDSISTYEVIDRENIVVVDIYDMEVAALNALRNLLGNLLGKSASREVDMKMPELLEVGSEKHGEYFAFVKQVQRLPVEV